MDRQNGSLCTKHKAKAFINFMYVLLQTPSGLDTSSSCLVEIIKLCGSLQFNATRKYSTTRLSVESEGFSQVLNEPYHRYISLIIKQIKYYDKIHPICFIFLWILYFVSN